MSASSKNVYAPLPTTARGEFIKMDGDPKGDTFAYTRGMYVIVRNLKNPKESYTFSGHAAKVSAVRYAPSGNYIASGDEKGIIKIWDTTQPDHKIKYEYQVLGGAVSDIAWSEDSKRLGISGNGNDTYARAILWDSGSNCGDITGHGKKINGIDIRPCRPYRLVTGGEDTDCGFYAGPPFKRDHMMNDSAKYVNAVRYSPDGSWIVSVDAGGKCFVYDGKEGTLKHELKDGASAHGAGVYSVSWSGDNKHCITCSADKTVKVWDVEGNKVVTTFTVGKDVQDMQVGCVWVGKHILSTSLSGDINFWDQASPNAPASIIKGHSSNITAMAVDAGSGKYFAGCSDGRTTFVSIESGQSEYFKNPHKAQVVDAKVHDGKLITASIDDTVRVTPVGGDSLGQAVKLSSQPQGVGAQGDLVAVAGKSHVTLIRGGSDRACEVQASYGANCAAISPSGGEVAIGGQDKKVHVYTIDGDTLTEKEVLSAGDVCLCVGYSPDGRYLAASGVKRQVLVWDATKYGDPIQERWKHHNSKVTCLAWSPNSQYIVTGSLDTCLFVWNMEKPMSRIKVQDAHPAGCVTSVQWADDNTVYSAGFDGCVRSWELKL